jgi:hypothetical protein
MSLGAPARSQNLGPTESHGRMDQPKGRLTGTRKYSANVATTGFRQSPLK